MPTPPQRPGEPGRRGRGPVPPPDPATRRLPRPGRPEAPTEQIRARPQPPEAATEQIRARPRPAEVATEKITKPRPPAAARPAGPPPTKPPAAPEGPQPAKRSSQWRSPQAIILIVVIAVSLVVIGLTGGELFARHKASSLLVSVAECVVEDNASVSFGVNPPFLWQHITGHYTNISVETAGKQVQAAKGMTADVALSDIRLQGTSDSKGTIGSLNATLTWTAAGIKDTVAENLPGVGSLVTDVSTDPAAGTITMEAVGDTKVTAKPVVNNGNLDLQITDVSGPFEKETVQTALDALMTKLNDAYPLGIHADSVSVTDTGVVGKFSSQNASIPNDGSDDACFAKL
ncbi:LmeA family phospholipid-binding protein [Mycolicibacterium peregrinum]|uniref:LmeA family phospholipid-binding protein n=1 Tax=Mycolicibacterium peregrinum TaxID=43304 RepID=UPI003AB0943F